MHSAVLAECFPGSPCTRDARTPTVLVYYDALVLMVPIVSDEIDAIIVKNIVQTIIEE